MHWTWVADFFGAALVANAVPHFVNGISGQPFPTPFADPPGRGESSPVVNVLWAAFNVALGWFLLWPIGGFEVRRPADAVAAALGALAVAVPLARAFGTRRGEARK